MSAQAVVTTLIFAPDIPTVEDDLQAKLTRFLELKELASQYEALKKELKPLFEGTEEISIGEFQVKGKYVEQPAKQIPAFRYWDMRIKKVG